MKTLSILHISDTHFGNKPLPSAVRDDDKRELDNSAEKRVDVKHKEVARVIKPLFGNNSWVDSFKRKLKEWQRKETLDIDLIAFTGDLCYCGNRADMETGILFLCDVCETLNISRDKLLISPGNHDLNRKKPGEEFKDLEELCIQYEIENYSSYENISKIEIKDIPIIALNTCLGATASVKNFKVDYFQKHILKLAEDKDFIEKIDEMSYDESFYSQTDLDIPIIGDKQLDDLLDIVSDARDTCFLLMHHNPIPNANIEIRPYSNLVDGGVILHELLETGKKFYILHGHTHLPTCISSFLPNNENENFISTVSCGCLNGNVGGKAQIIEASFTDNNECFKTTIHQLTKKGAVFSTSKDEINNRDIVPSIRINWSILKKGQTYTFIEAKDKLVKELPDDEIIEDDDVLMGLLNCTKAFKINKNGNSDYKEWKFTVTQ